MMKPLNSSLYPEGVVLRDLSLYEKGFGAVQNNELVLFPEEAVFLYEAGKILINSKDPKKYFARKDKNFLKRYVVYKDLRERGFIPKSGAKYGADFRVYEKGVKLTDRQHSKYLVWVLDQDTKIDLKTFIGINRIAHSVKKRLLLAMVDKDLGITYIQNTRVLL